MKPGTASMKASPNGNAACGRLACRWSRRRWEDAAHISRVILDPDEVNDQ